MRTSSPWKLGKTLCTQLWDTEDDGDESDKEDGGGETDKEDGGATGDTEEEFTVSLFSSNLDFL